MSTTLGGTGAVPEIEDLRTRVAGTVVEPGNASYDEARRVWNGMIDVRPRAVVHAAEDSASVDERARTVYGEANHRRLVELKNRYDPDNVFRGNHNIQPTA